VCAVFHEATLFEDEDHVGGLDGGEPVGDRQSLFFAARHAVTAFADEGVVAVVELEDSVVDRGGAGGGVELGVGVLQVKQVR
jgi:hypothetical protein